MCAGDAFWPGSTCIWLTYLWNWCGIGCSYFQRFLGDKLRYRMMRITFQVFSRSIQFTCIGLFHWSFFQSSTFNVLWLMSTVGGRFNQLKCRPRNLGTSPPPPGATDTVRSPGLCYRVIHRNFHLSALNGELGTEKWRARSAICTCSCKWWRTSKLQPRSTFRM